MTKEIIAPALPGTLKINWTVELKWNNPYTNPPDGMPHILERMIVDGPHITDEVVQKMTENHPNYKLGCGYSLHLLPPDKPVNRWTEEQKAKARLTRRRNYIKHNFPLFADEFIESLESTDWAQEVLNDSK